MNTSLHRGKMISKKSTRNQKAGDRRSNDSFPQTLRSNKEAQERVLGKPGGEY
jgi:hypothetical protein